MLKSNNKPETNKLLLLIIGMSFLAFIIIIRLFYLQIISHSYYKEIATRAQRGYTELPAQRGEIIIKDHHSGEEFPLATNTTLDLLFVDPVLIKDPILVTNELAPLLINIEDLRATDNERIRKLQQDMPKDLTEEERKELIRPLSDEELKSQFYQELLEKISTKQRKSVLLRTDLPLSKLQEIRNLNLNGIDVIESYVYAYPPQITNSSILAEKLAPYIEIPSARLEQVLKGENRYSVLKRKLDYDISNKIKKLISKDKENFRGIGLKEEYFRFYPEGSLAANIIGYVNHQNIGQYGIENAFHTRLEGKVGKLQTKQDSIGRQITVGESNLEAAVDGDDIILTIDRSIQLEVERILEKAVRENSAEAGQILVMNPQTGAIIAMAHHPSFNPNNYGETFARTEIKFTPEEMENLVPTQNEGEYHYYFNPIGRNRYLVFEEVDEEGKSRYYRYTNFFGPEVYHNKIISWPYEPGSVFKTIAMAIGIDSGEVTPNTRYNDTGPVGVDWNRHINDYEFYIRNANEKYLGQVNMTTILGESLNTGMTYLAKKIGPNLFYNYLKKFGLLNRTDIELPNEAKGLIRHFDEWTESALATHSFGQGLTITMLQLGMAYSTIANGGVLMQPYIVDEIKHGNGNITKNEPKQIRRVISEDTASKMTAMLTHAIEHGAAPLAKTTNHFVAGKTGTSQTYRHGRALTGAGTTIGGFGGYAPIDNPQFVIIVKIDHPRRSPWGSVTAAPAFREIAEHLFKYYNIPPDKN